MPTEVKMLVRLKQRPEELSLPALRHEFMRAMSLNEEDFRSGGPLELLGEKEREFMPVKDNASVWLNVNLWRAYYGIGYERGDLTLFIRCTEWLEQRLPQSQVYYGHDVDDENITLFDKNARDNLMEHFRQDRH
jgi:hypothetical protein